MTEKKLEPMADDSFLLKKLQCSILILVHAILIVRSSHQYQ